MSRKANRSKKRNRVREQYDFWSTDCTVPIHKARLKDCWRAVKDPKWYNQDADYIRDVHDGSLYPHHWEKGEHKVERMIKHKLYFHIPFTDADKALIHQTFPYYSFEYVIGKQQENVDRIIEREKRKQNKN